MTTACDRSCRERLFNGSEALSDDEEVWARMAANGARSIEILRWSQVGSGAGYIKMHAAAFQDLGVGWHTHVLFSLVAVRELRQWPSAQPFPSLR